MLVGDEHRNQYFQVNVQVLTFFQFYFPMRSRNSIWPEINPCWCGWRWWGAQWSGWSSIVCHQMSQVWSLGVKSDSPLVSSRSSWPAINPLHAGQTILGPHLSSSFHHQPESYVHTRIQVCVLYSTEACWHLSPSFHQLDLLCPHSLIIAEVLPLRELAWVAQRRTCLGDQPTRGSTWLHGTGN